MIETWEKCLALIDRIESNRVKMSELVNTLYPIQKKNYRALIMGKATMKDVEALEHVLSVHESKMDLHSDNVVVPRSKNTLVKIHERKR